MNATNKPWIPWPETFNAGTCDENGAWAALQAAEDFFDSNYSFAAFFDLEAVDGYRHAEGGYEFFMGKRSESESPLVLRVWLDENRVERAEVRR